MNEEKLQQYMRELDEHIASRTPEELMDELRACGVEFEGDPPKSPTEQLVELFKDAPIVTPETIQTLEDAGKALSEETFTLWVRTYDIWSQVSEHVGLMDAVNAEMSISYAHPFDVEIRDSEGTVI